MRPNPKPSRTAATLTLIAALSGTPTSADTFVTFSPPNSYNRLWSSSEWWGLEVDCGLYPHRGNLTCCQCGPEPNWHVTLASAIGARFDVEVELAGLQHRQAQVDLGGHSLLVFGAATLGDGDPATPAPSYVNTGSTAALLTFEGPTEFTDTHTYVFVEGLTTAGTTTVHAGSTVNIDHACPTLNLPGGTWMLVSDAVVQGSGGPPVFQNEGSVVKTGVGIAALRTNLIGNGAILVTAGELGLDRDVAGAGLLSVDAGALLSMTSGGFSTTWSGTIAGGGDVSFGQGRTAVLDGPYDIAGLTTIDTNAVVTFNGPAETARLRFADSSAATGIRGALVVRDELEWEGGELIDGSLELMGKGRLGGGPYGVPVVENAQLVFTSVADVLIEGNGLRARDGGIVENHGRVELKAAPLAGSGTGTWRNHGRLAMDSGTSYVSLEFVNEGRLSVTNATMVFDDDLVQVRGRTRLDGGILGLGVNTFELQGGQLVGAGTVDGGLHLDQGSTLSPGFHDASGIRGGELVVQGGGLVQEAGSNARFHLGGRLRGHEYDAVTGTSPWSFTLGGCLSVELVDGFEQEVLSADEFVLYDSTNKVLQGAFDNVASGQRIWTRGAAGSFQVFYGPTSPYPPGQVVLTGFLPRAPAFGR